MKKILFFVFVLTLNGCDYFTKKNIEKEKILQEELKKINWKTVDELPSITNCDSIQDLAAKKDCFFNTITAQLQEKIQQDSVLNTYTKLDTIPFKVVVNSNGLVVLKPELQKYKDVYNPKILDSVFQIQLQNTFRIEPAIKRGIKVKSQFTISVIVNSNTNNIEVK